MQCMHACMAPSVSQSVSQPIPSIHPSIHPSIRKHSLTQFDDDDDDGATYIHTYMHDASIGLTRTHLVAVVSPNMGIRLDCVNFIYGLQVPAKPHHRSGWRATVPTAADV